MLSSTLCALNGTGFSSWGGWSLTLCFLWGFFSEASSNFLLLLFWGCTGFFGFLYGRLLWPLLLLLLLLLLFEFPLLLLLLFEDTLEDVEGALWMFLDGADWLSAFLFLWSVLKWNSCVFVGGRTFGLAGALIGCVWDFGLGCDFGCVGFWWGFWGTVLGCRGLDCTGLDFGGCFLIGCGS